MFPKSVTSHVLFEMQQIDKLLEMYNNLFDKCRRSEPDLIEITALASVLHSFYNGIENIFLAIAKKIDKEVPEGKQWHRDLLIQLSVDRPNRKAIISKDLKIRLAEYMAFRHYYRHSYSFFLKWNELKELIVQMFEVWEEFKRELELFIKN